MTFPSIESKMDSTHKNKKRSEKNKKFNKQSKGTFKNNNKNIGGSTDDKSVFAVTERFLQKKKAKSNVKETEIETLETKNKGDVGKTQTKEEQLAEIDSFFKNKYDVKDKKKPKWFDSKIKNVIEVYINSVVNLEKEATLQNEVVKKLNEKKMFRFFKKLTSIVKENIDVLNHWYHITKEEIMKSKSTVKESVLKISLLNRKIKAITKEVTELPSEKKKTKEDDQTPPAWFDNEMAGLIKLRNKAKRQWKLNPTKENEASFRLAFKNVKIELIKRKKSGFVSEEPYRPAKTKKTELKKSNLKFGGNPVTMNIGSKLAKSRSSNKHIKFD